MEEPQRKLFLPDASLELRTQELLTGPRTAQCTSDTVLPRKRSLSVEGRLRLHTISYGSQI